MEIACQNLAKHGASRQCNQVDQAGYYELRTVDLEKETLGLAVSAQLPPSILLPVHRASLLDRAPAEIR